MKQYILILVVLILSACQASGPLATQIADSNTAIAQTATGASEWTTTPTASPSLSGTISTPAATYTPTPSPQPSPTVTLPSSIVEVPICNTSICEVPEPDENILARLCVVEVRGFGDKRRIACLSVISTVLTRKNMHIYSDGTISGTITWGCTPENGCLQFPGFVVNGCQGITPEACPWAYPADIAFFQAVAREALNGVVGGGNGCYDFLYYGSRDMDMTPDACIITSQNGLEKEGFHN